MKILVLEDSSERNKYFSRVFLNQELIITNNINSFTELISQLKFQVIFLDHDLGGHQMVESSNYNTGFTATKLINESKQNDKSLIVIHSFNNIGAKNMYDNLINHEGQVIRALYMSTPFTKIISNLLGKNNVK